MSELENLNQEISNCTKCSLHSTRTNTVPGMGSPNADLMFIGEAPGANEDKQGLPFVGAAGKFLDEMLQSIGLQRADIFIGNVLKCRPPGNRDPEQEEVSMCWPYLEKQICLIKPKLIVTLGRHAMNRFLPDMRISRDHGQPKRYRGIYSKMQIYFPLYHPAAALYNGSLRKTLLDDFQKIPKVLELIDQEGNYLNQDS